MKSLQQCIYEAKCDKPTKMDIENWKEVIRIPAIIDAWRLIDKHDMRWCTDNKKYPDVVFINREDWEKAKAKANNLKYFDTIEKSNFKIK